MNGKFFNSLFNLDAKHALYREDGRWYHHLKAFPGVLFDQAGYVIFENHNDYLTNPLLQHKKDLHVINGISGIPSYIRFSPDQLTILDSQKNKEPERAVRELREIDFILRNRALVKKIKVLYGNHCQICGIRLELKKNLFYSEVHHIIPLGMPHNGPDCLENMICVCPNHHVLLDLKSMALDVSNLTYVKHEISDEYINIYNQLVRSNHRKKSQLT